VKAGIIQLARYQAANLNKCLAENSNLFALAARHIYLWAGVCSVASGIAVTQPKAGRAAFIDRQQNMVDHRVSRGHDVLVWGLHEADWCHEKEVMLDYGKRWFFRLWPGHA
jgi:hypothetical protein